MTLALPSTEQFFASSWEDMKPFFDQLLETELNEDNVAEWMADWTQLSEYVFEMGARHRINTTRFTEDEAIEAGYHAFLKEIYPHVSTASQALTKKFLAAELTLPGMELPLKKMRSEAALFREENIPLQTQENMIATKFNKVIGARTITWDGEEYTITGITPLYEGASREDRKKIWNMAVERESQDREAINEMWAQSLELRLQQAKNAGYDDYRAYRWELLKRFDYTPENCVTFHNAIIEAVVPAANKIYEDYRVKLGVDSIRPWDLELYQTTSPIYYPPLRPFETVDELTTKTRKIFHKVDPRVGQYFDIMVEEDLLDLENRKGKAGGAYCSSFPTKHQPFVFMNAVGMGTDIKTLLHESGHAFHVFEVGKLPYMQQRRANMEFNEVASMAMELLASPYLTKADGGFYTQEEYARAKIQHLEKIVLFWPYMAVVDAFQHWVYENPADAKVAANCDRMWSSLVDKFMPAIDWTGLEDEKSRGWHRKQHIHRSPFYYIEYGLAQLGAVQIWRNAIDDQAGAVASYLSALSLGGTVSLPALYEAAGAKFAFDADTLRDAVSLISATIDGLKA